jgi:hypothetical protein
MRHWLGLASGIVIALAVGCGGEAPGGSPGAMDEGSGGSGGGTSVAQPASPTFAEVYEKALAPHGCTDGYCHHWEEGPADVSAAKRAYASLVGVAAPGDDCGGAERVVPGDPEHSLVFLKVSMAKPPCGARMPFHGDPLTAEQVDLIRAWIEGGAPE